jgi:DNA (cytosine-5)-methyltransferase 1
VSLHFIFANNEKLWYENLAHRGGFGLRPTKRSKERLRTVELFAGVGGFREGLRRAGGFEVVWSNQWEPGARDQFASKCYVSHFEHDHHVCDDIERVLDVCEGKQSPPLIGGSEYMIPEHDLLVGGFPCQDYSVAKPLNQAHGIIGKKGVLWWQIYRLLKLKGDSRPRFVLLENVDRLLKSPGRQRGRDFAIILSCFRQLGYTVEWRVINAADYRFPQKRRRVFILAQRTEFSNPLRGPEEWLQRGLLGHAFPIAKVEKNLFGESDIDQFELPADPHEATIRFGMGRERHNFCNAGVMIDGLVWTRRVEADQTARQTSEASTLGEVVAKTDEANVPREFYVAPERLETWKYLKGAKNEERVHKKSGATYFYTEGALPFPDPLDRPARTILTAEGGSSPSRFKHIIEVGRGKYRRLVPDELEELNGFPRGWTATGMSDIKRAFCMGNALVVGVVERIGGSIWQATRAVRGRNHLLYEPERLPLKR